VPNKTTAYNLAKNSHTQKVSTAPPADTFGDEVSPAGAADVSAADGTLRIRNIQKRFGSQLALASVNLDIKKGEFFSLLGPSGCGKSTLLRILAGLESASEGEILWGNRRIDPLPARERPFNMVFQKYALFPHLTVFDNIAFSLSLKNVARSEIQKRVNEVLELVTLQGFADRLPETLSGGQAQRVALARALVNEPACVLLDEPLTALDQKLREHMQTELRLLQKRLGLTFIFVTHDQEEALLLSDRIAVMNNGVIEQVAEPRELYDSPSSLFGARFVGHRNELSTKVTAIDSTSGLIELQLTESGKSLRGRMKSGIASLNTNVQTFIRPERFTLLPVNGTRKDGNNVLDGVITQVLFRGTRIEIILAHAKNLSLRLFTDSTVTQWQAGQSVSVEFSPEDTHVFNEAT